MLLQPTTAVLQGDFNIFNFQLLHFDLILYSILLYCSEQAKHPILIFVSCSAQAQTCFG